MIDRGDMVEHALVHSNYYGTSKEFLRNIHLEGRIALLDIDVKGVQSISQIMNLNAVFLLPPSLDILEARLRGRSTETEYQIAKRLDRGRQ